MSQSLIHYIKKIKVVDLKLNLLLSIPQTNLTKFRSFML